MRLLSISYTEYEGQPYEWALDEVSLLDINLIVGKNATGKSRLLRVINGLARLIEGKILPSSLLTARYEAVFVTNSAGESPSAQAIRYKLDIDNNKVILEKLIVNDETRLDRGPDGRGSIYFQKNDQYIDIHVPPNLLATAARRDPQQHAFFEGLHDWANTIRFFEFNKIDTNALVAFDGKLSFDELKGVPLQANLHLIVKLGKEKFGRDLVSPVISDMRKIGYSITDFGLAPVKGVVAPMQTPGVPHAIYVMESGVDKRLMQNELSDGMLRALSTLIYLHFIKLQKDRGCILIDDIGEGLDFERSTKLISVIVKHAESGYLQVSMTTNDRFVMNNVPLKYWCVMERTDGRVRVYNERNAKDRFDEFEEYGFNNFDFFAKGFFSRGVKYK